MAMTVKWRKDVKRPSVFLKKTADIPGGVCVSSYGLNNIDYLPEGTPISRPCNGLHYVCRIKWIEQTAPDYTAVYIKGSNPFNVGDTVYGVEDYEGDDLPNSYKTVTKIEREADRYKITLDSAFSGGERYIGAYVHIGDLPDKELSRPYALIGSGVPVTKDDNIIVDAWVAGVVKREQRNWQDLNIVDYEGLVIPRLLCKGLTGFIFHYPIYDGEAAII